MYLFVPPLWRHPMRRPFLLVLVLAVVISPSQRGDANDRSGVLPDSLLQGPAARELREVMEGAAFVGEKKGVAFKGHPLVFEYLLNHLDFTSQVARALDLSDYAIVQTGTESYEATTPKGGWARLRVVYADGDKRVVLAQGRYGRAVVVLRYASFDRGGEWYMVNDLYGYVRADNPLLNVLLGLFSWTLQGRVERVFSSVAKLSERAYESPTALFEELFAHPELPPDHILEFVEIVNRVSRHEAGVPLFPGS